MKGQACKKLQNPLSFCAYFQVFSTELSSSHSGLFDSHWPSIYTLLKLFLGILRSCQGVTSDFKVILYREILQSIFSAFSSHEWTIGLAKVWGKIEQFMFSLTFLRLVFHSADRDYLYLSIIILQQSVKVSGARVYLIWKSVTVEQEFYKCRLACVSTEQLPWPLNLQKLPYHQRNLILLKCWVQCVPRIWESELVVATL